MPENRTYLLESRWICGPNTATEFATINVPKDDDWIERALRTRDRIIYPQMLCIAREQMIDLFPPHPPKRSRLVRLMRVEGEFRVEDRTGSVQLPPVRLTMVCTFTYDNQRIPDAPTVHPV